MSAPRLPPTHCLLAFDALARLRDINLASEELNVTPSAITHRIRQLETHLDMKLFNNIDFSLSPEGNDYLQRLREALALLYHVPGRRSATSTTPLQVAVSPTFSRELLMPRLASFRHAQPDIELVLQVITPMLNMQAEEADLAIRFGTAPFPGYEYTKLLSDNVIPVCSPDYLNEVGPLGQFDELESVQRVRLIRCPQEPWRTWFTGCNIALDEPLGGAQFDDMGLVLDAAAGGFGVALMRLELAKSWIESGQLLRLSNHSIPSPHDYYLCWKPGTLERWECASFVQWIRQALQ